MINYTCTMCCSPGPRIQSIEDGWQRRCDAHFDETAPDVTDEASRLIGNRYALGGGPKRRRKPHGTLVGRFAGRYAILPDDGITAAVVEYCTDYGYSIFCEWVQAESLDTLHPLSRRIDYHLVADGRMAGLEHAVYEFERANQDVLAEYLAARDASADDDSCHLSPEEIRLEEMIDVGVAAIMGYDDTYPLRRADVFWEVKPYR